MTAARSASFRLAWLFGLLILAASTSPHALDFNDGKWRVIIETETRGMAVKIPPKYQYEHCLTRKDFKPDLAPLHDSCKTTDTVTDGNETTWKFACKQSGANVYGNGRLKFAGNRFEGVINTVSENPQRLEVIQRLTGRRLGACDARDKQQAPTRKPPTQLPDYK